MKAILLKIILTLCIPALLSFAHPFYLGVTNLTYNSEEKALQGYVKLFVNDLEDALSKINKRKVDLLHITDTAGTQQLLSLYLKTHFSLELNHKAKKFELIGFEKEEDVLLMYIEFLGCEAPESIHIKNRLLYDFLPAQTNIVRLDVFKQASSLKAVNPEQNFLFEFIK